MTYLKHSFKRLCLIVLLISSVQLYSQDIRGVLNQDLPASFVEEKKQEAEQVSLTIYQALLDKDLNELMLYVPDKATYLQMAAHYNYRNDEERTKAISRINENYEEHKENMLSKFKESAQILKSKNSLTLLAFEMNFHPKRPFPGGKAGLSFKNQKGSSCHILLDGLYFFNDRWYVLKGVSFLN